MTRQVQTGQISNKRPMHDWYRRSFVRTFRQSRFRRLHLQTKHLESSR